jgi:hypothetical protein
VGGSIDYGQLAEALTRVLARRPNVVVNGVGLDEPRR